MDFSQKSIGVASKKFSDYVGKLQKGLNGLNQAP